MTLLISKAQGGTNVIRTYTVLPAHTVQVVASDNSANYMKGSIFINDLTDSLFFEYSISNFNGILTTVIYGMIGKEFNITISDFTSGTNTGLAITNNESVNLSIALVQEL